MKERSLILHQPNADEMVRAILDDQKTQFRVPVKPQPAPFGEDSPFTQATIKQHIGKPWMPVGGVFQDAWKKPFGTVGDRLWVKETWRPEYENDTGAKLVRYRCDGGSSEMCGYESKLWLDVVDGSDLWHPSIHMPRWASRIDLEITRVWVERVQDITEEDAKKEGIVESEIGRLASRVLANYKMQTRAPAVLQFADLWQSIYGTWDANPFVWAYEFRRIKP